MPNKDPLTSSVAKNFETSKKVEGLLNRLANYMAGDIPDAADLADLFAAKDEPDGSTDFGVDDATTNYTKDEPSLPKLKVLSLEPIYAPPVNAKPPNSIDAETGRDSVSHFHGLSDEVIPEEPLDDSKHLDTYLPNIYEFL